MSNDRRVAAALLNRASSIVSTERGAQHGSAEESFSMIAEMWSTYITNVVFRRTGVRPLGVHLTATDVLNMMADLKKARALWGNGQEPDHYIDGLGYIALAGMLNLPDTFIQRALEQEAALTAAVSEAVEEMVMQSEADTQADAPVPQSLLDNLRPGKKGR